MTTLTAERVAELIIYNDEFANGTAIEHDTVIALRELAAILDAVAAAPESPEAFAAVYLGEHLHTMRGTDPLAITAAAIRVDRQRVAARHEAEKQALRAELKQARSHAEQYLRKKRHVSELLSAQVKTTAAAQADADALRAALKKYGSHAYSCGSRLAPDRVTVAPCDCSLDAALEEYVDPAPAPTAPAEAPKLDDFETGMLGWLRDGHLPMVRRFISLLEERAKEKP